MARRMSGGGGGFGGGLMAPVLSVGCGLLIFVVLIIFAPTIAGSIQNATDIPNGTCSTGNTTATAPAGEFNTGPLGECGLRNTTATSSNDEFDTAYDTWNPDFDTTIPNGVQDWTTNIQILAVVILIISISVGLYYLKGMA